MNLKHILWTLLLCCCAVTAGAQTYRVGDLYTAPDGSQGIVFFVFPDGTGGWVVALNDAPEGCYWGSYVDITDLMDIMPTNYQELLADTSGYTNTAIIRNQLNNNNYAAGVVDFANGWYLPAMGQLRMLYSKRSILDTLLVAAGGTKFANGSYWSSSEVSSTNAWVIEFGSHYNQGQCYSTSKYLSCHVRAVRTFTYEPTYVWSTGDTAVSITVAPLQTTEYTVTISSPVGCSNDETYNVLVNSLDTTPVNITACESYTWNGVTYDTSGIFLEHHQNANGCDSMVILYLTINNPIHQSITATGIEGYEWHDSVYTQDGDYLFSHLDANGCMQVDTLHLTIYHGTTTQFDTTVCESDLPMEWGGVIFAEVGTHVDSLETFEGADSLVFWNVHVVEMPLITHTPDTAVLAGDSLTLWAAGSDILTWTDSDGNPVGGGATISVRPLTSGYYFVTGYSSGAIVGEDSSVLQCPATDSIWVEVLPNPDTMLLTDSVCVYYVWYGDTLTQSDVYYHTMTNQLGYDSVEVLTLTVFPTSTFDTFAIACDQFTWRDSIYTESGVVVSYLTNAVGCDSVVTLHLTITNTDYTDYTDEVCDSLRWIDGNLYTESTDGPTFTLTNAAGCDSVVTLHLTITNTDHTDYTDDVCDSLRWIDGNLYTESTDGSTFTLTNAAGCDSVVTLHLTVRHSTGTTLNAEVVQNNLPYTLNDSTYTATGTYYQHFTNAAGCDSTVTLNLTVYHNTTAQVYATVCASALPYTWSGHVFAEAGTFTDTLLTTHGADSVVTYTLTVDNISATIGNVDHIVCYGDSTGFAAATVTGGQPPMTCAWTNTANITLSTTTTLIDVPAGFYTFTVTDVIGCTAVDTVTIISLFGEVDPGTISADQVVCVGEQPAPFTGTAATGSDHIIYFWEFSSDGEIWSTAQGDYNTQNYTYPYPAPFSFFLHRMSIIQGCGIYYSNVVTVSVWPNTMDTIMAAVCQNEPYEGFGFDITADQTDAPGDYTFEQHHSTGHCDSVVVLILTVNPLFETEVEDVVCEGDGYDDNGFSIAPMETVGEELLTRTQTLQSAAGCDSVVTLQLRVIDTAVRIVSLTPDFCEDLSAELMVVTDMPNYVWSTGETAPTITVTHSGRYYVTATSGDCSSTAHFTVENCDGDQLLLPNAITPSRGDGLNDYFSIPERNLRSINLFEIWIYNRWGELVYYSNDKNFRWNGEYRGQTQYQTVYNYVIRYTDAAGKPYFVKGSVTVL